MFWTLSGAVTLLDGVMVMIFYSLGWFLVASLRFASEQWRVVRQGVTSFELDHHIKVFLSLVVFLVPMFTSAFQVAIFGYTASTTSGIRQTVEQITTNVLFKFYTFFYSYHVFLRF